MSMTDRMELGYFPLQDWGKNVPVGMRLSLGGGRVARVETDEASSADETMLEYARVHGMGTLGDVHPWMFLQTRDRSVRAMGSWSQVFGTMVVEGGGRYAARVRPLRDDEFRSDHRYAPLQAKYPKCFPRLARGSMMIVLPSMDEEHQDELAFWADPRLIAPHISGPGAAGTLVCDLQPRGEICMDEADEPGEDGRHARLQSLMRVVAIRGSLPLLGGRGNIIATNHAATNQEKLAGYGAVWTRMVGNKVGRRPPVTPSGEGPQSQDASPKGKRNKSSRSTGEQKIGRGSFGSNLEDGPQGGGEEKPTPCEFGEFKPRQIGGHGTAFMSHVASGPLHGGALDDKHHIGDDADGNPINSGHISTDAYFFRSQGEDGPFLFEGDYPHPPPWPLKARVHLTWDGSLPHKWIGGLRSGKWRWWSEVPYVSPRTPGRPTTPGVPTPGRPTTPGRPSTPGRPTTPTTPPTRPTTPGRGGGRGTPTTPRDPRITPITPPTGSPLPTNPGDIRPVPTGFRHPNPTGPGPRPTPNPTGPTVRPPDTEEIDPEKGQVRFPNSGRGAGPDGAIDQRRRIGQIVPVGPYGSGGGGSRGGQPAINLGESYGDGGVIEQVPGLVPTVGAGLETLGKYSIFHPMQTGFAAITFRPQLWVQGYPNFEHNPMLPATRIENDEEVRPQVLAMRAFGGQNDSGDWAYEDRPHASLARGGRVKGGVLFSPPDWEMEDFFGIVSQKSVTLRDTGAFVTAAQGVGVAWGEPHADGGLKAGSVYAHRYSTATPSNYRGLRFTHLNTARTEVDSLRLKVDEATDEIVVEVRGTGAIRVPIGTTAQRNATIPDEAGHLRINTDAGTADRLEYYDGADWESAFAVSEHISTSAGAADAGKPVILNASGLIDGSMNGAAATDHGALTGLGDDDHTQYLLADGTRALTGDLDFAGNDATFDDNAKAVFGTGADAEIYYNGTDLIINPDAVGAGSAAIQGACTISNTLTVSANVTIDTGGFVDAAGGFKDNGTAGIDKSFVFTDGDAFTHDVVISGGIITQWDVT